MDTHVQYVCYAMNCSVICCITEMKLYVETSIRLSSHPFLSDEGRRNYL